MKLSRYNILLPFNSQMSENILYNSFNNSLAILEAGEIEAWKKIVDDSTFNIDPELLIDLQRGGFVIDSEVDELSKVRNRLISSRNSTRTLGLTIAPTTSCNFTCTYCYEKSVRRNIRMSVDIQRDIIKYLETKAPYIDNLYVTWFGGEPLLEQEIIEELSNKFISISREHNFRYSSGIITNGYLLADGTIDMFKRCRITNCQITLDGLHTSHNERRPHVSGKKTFTRIVNNIIKINKASISTSIRVNVDKLNMNEFNEIRSYLSAHGLNDIIVYPAPILNINDCYDKQLCLSSYEFKAYEYTLLTTTGDVNDLLLRYPRLMGNVCCADSVNGIVIDSDGELYKCWSDIGNSERKFGNISTGILNSDNEFRYIHYDPTNNNLCKGCVYLPICMGGCPRKYINKDPDKCIYFEDLFEKYLFSLAKSLM